MWYWTTKILSILGGIVAVALGIFLLRLISRGRRKKRMRRPGLLELHLDGALPEANPSGGLRSLLSGPSLTVVGLLDGLDRAARDPKIKGLVLRISAPMIGLARVQEIRDAILRFSASGKPTFAFAETFGEAQNGIASYYLATACSNITMQPSGDLNFVGFAAQTPFLKGSLEKLGVTPRLAHRKAYKNAMNMFTEEDYTPEHRESVDRLLSEMLEQILEGVSERRGQDIALLRDLLDQSPLSAEQAMESKLIDGVLYRDELYDELKEKLPRKTQVLSLSNYIAKGRYPTKKGTRVALIHGLGGVARGRSRPSGLSGQTNMGSDTICAAFRDAIKDKKVKAILFRVDSRGGSYVASDTIWRMVKKARERGKVVVATMGDIAGSGGYYVAMAANKVLAQPGTLTGSIGVVGGKMLTQRFWERLGVQWRLLLTNENADLFSSHTDYSEKQWAQFQQNLDRIYGDFVSKVAESRALTEEEAEAVAQGRVWSGRDALTNRLVDQLGGFHEALACIRSELDLGADAALQLRLFPVRKTLWVRLLGRGRPEEPRPLQDAIEGIQGQLAQMQELTAQAGLTPPSGVIQMDDLGVFRSITS
jgi:protease-4